MSKSKMLIAATVIAVLLLPFSVFAATSNTPVAKNIRGFLGINTSKLTDQQKADIKDYTQKAADLQKEFINKMVSNGALTKEQGDAEIKRIDEMLKNGDVNGFLPGSEKWKGGLRGSAGQGNSGLGKLDTSKLTDEQKTALTDIYKKISDLQKSLIDKMVSDGLMTKEQGDAAAKKIDEISKGIDENGLSEVTGLMLEGFSGFGCFGVKGINTSKLTDQQKADLDDFSASMASLQKEFVNKLVTYGLITEAQGNTAVQRIDNAGKNGMGQGFFNGTGMKKGHFEGKRGMPGSFGKKSSPANPGNTTPAT